MEAPGQSSEGHPSCPPCRLQRTFVAREGWPGVLCREKAPPVLRVRGLEGQEWEMEVTAYTCFPFPLIIHPQCACPSLMGIVSRAAWEELAPLNQLEQQQINAPLPFFLGWVKDNTSAQTTWTYHNLNILAMPFCTYLTNFLPTSWQCWFFNIATQETWLSWLFRFEVGSLTAERDPCSGSSK